MQDKHIIGIVANVDAGKTTLTESILYTTGKLKKIGRVDNKDAFLDTEALEKARGITIFSKSARMIHGNREIILLDTPGHVDFSMEMERTLSVLDYAILVISAPDGVEGHSLTLWRLLKQYNIPVFIFVNKMDQYDFKVVERLEHLKQYFGDGCIDFTENTSDEFFEHIALRQEVLLDQYLKKGRIELADIATAVQNRKIFPCFFGSALKLEGIAEFFQRMTALLRTKAYPSHFGARVYKIARDDQGQRLVHLKITGGTLSVKDLISHGDHVEKVNQIRKYDGRKYENVQTVKAGDVCAITGAEFLKAGMALGIERVIFKMQLEPVLSYRILLPEGMSEREGLPKLKEIEDEHPELSIEWDPQLKEIHARVMGDVQIEILKEIIQKRFQFTVEFGSGRIVYKETICNRVEGVGHFEPLRHYAEVHVLLSPAERGSGLQFESDCDEIYLTKNWQNLVLAHLMEKTHKGVLIGAPLTDVKMTLVSGRAHLKHTEGGDFREATYRAVRQGLMEAECILLEPYYDFKLSCPQYSVGRAMIDIGNMGGTCEVAQQEGGQAIVVGKAPVSQMRHYYKEVIAYTKGFGRLDLSIAGYDLCQNSEEIIQAFGYDPERDLSSPTGSVFCAQGSGYFVPWDEVKAQMHVPAFLNPKAMPPDRAVQIPKLVKDMFISSDEIDAILSQTAFANQGKKTAWKHVARQKIIRHETYGYAHDPYPSNHSRKDQYLLVDGYNIIFAWDDLKVLADEHMDAAKTKLLDTLSNYKAIHDLEVIVVFDAYRLKGHPEETFDYHNIHVVYTKEAQTADQYIEKFSYEHRERYQITVATSDGIEQMIVRGAGSLLLSARELKLKVSQAESRIAEVVSESKEDIRTDLSASFERANQKKDHKE